MTTNASATSVTAGDGLFCSRVNPGRYRLTIETGLSTARHDADVTVNEQVVPRRLELAR